LIISLQIGLYAGLLNWLIFATGESDFVWAIRAARDLLAGRDPYAYPYDASHIPYPLPAAFVGLPFVWFPNRIGAALFFGISSAILAYGLSKEGYHRLLTFLSLPFVSATFMGQWTPLIMASAFFPIFLGLAVVKPQTGIPIFISNFSKKATVLCAALLGLSLLIRPTWPIVWLSQIGPYDKFFPILTSPGFLLLVLLFNYRSKSARYLLLCALMPQRMYYDTLILWLIPKTSLEFLVTVGLSWLAGILRFVFPGTIEYARIWMVTFVYCPMCFLVMKEKWVPAKVDSLSPAK
jgi:hypothetical protein